MIAEKTMVRNPETAGIDERVGDVLQRMRGKRMRMVPVVDLEGHIHGVFSTFSIMEHVVPDYIVSGDLESVPYVPELGLLVRQYQLIADKRVEEVMDRHPLVVKASEELLSVAAAMINYGKHEYALVVDGGEHLVGVISAGDVLDCLADPQQLGIAPHA